MILMVNLEMFQNNFTDVLNFSKMSLRYQKKNKIILYEYDNQMSSNQNYFILFLIFYKKKVYEVLEFINIFAV